MKALSTGMGIYAAANCKKTDNEKAPVELKIVWMFASGVSDISLWSNVVVYFRTFGDSISLAWCHVHKIK